MGGGLWVDGRLGWALGRGGCVSEWEVGICQCRVIWCSNVTAFQSERGQRVPDYSIHFFTDVTWVGGRGQPVQGHQVQTAGRWLNGWEVGVDQCRVTKCRLEVGG